MLYRIVVEATEWLLLTLISQWASHPCNKEAWNFRKANWPAFEDILENRLDESKINFDQHPDKIVSSVNPLTTDYFLTF